MTGFWKGATRVRKVPGVLVIPAFCFFSGICQAQKSSDPDIGYVYPAGGKRGTVVEVTVGGQHLASMTKGWVSGEGVQATVTDFTRPLPRKRVNEFREALTAHRKGKKDAMQAGTGGMPRKEDVTSILKKFGATEEEIRLYFLDREQRSDPKRQKNSQLVETVTLRLEISPDAAKGPRTLRLFGRNGLSNPMAFFIGDFPEECQPAPTEPLPPSPTPIRLPVVLNGQIMPGESKRYLFHADRGERLVFLAQTRDLIPYLADTVPGWFQSVLTIFDSTGSEVASAQSARFAPDPVLAFDVKNSGDYQLEIRDSLYRGREDFVYRITAGRIPFVTGIFPLGGSSDSETKVEVSGWNLPRQLLSIRVPPGEGIQPVPQLANGFATMDVAFAHDTVSEIFAAEPDNDTAHAALVAVPTTINGRIDTPGDADIFAVKCKKGEPLAFEVFARKLNSPLDSFLRITDAAGKQVAYNDDQEDLGSGLLTHHADSRIQFDPPSNALFYVELGDAQRQGGPEFSYRLRIDRPRPDFALRVVPSGINGAPGTSVPVTVYAMRKDGFAGDINLTASPSEFVLSGGCIPKGSDSVSATLTFPESSKGGLEPVEITGAAEISGAQVTHKAVPADDLLQAFFYRHLVPATELVAYSKPGRPLRKPLQIAPGTVKISPASTGHATVLLPKFVPKAGLKAELKNPPEGIWIEGTSPCQDGIKIAFRADTEKAKPGLRGNLILELTALKTAGKGEKPKGEERWSMGVLPAVPFEIQEK